MASISDILLAQGQQASESRRRRAGNWMPLVQTLSQLPGQVMADRAAERDAREAGFDRDQQRTVRGQQIAKGEQDLATAEASADQKRQMNELLATPGIIGEDGRFDVQAAQRTATEKGYRDILDDVLAFGTDWNEGVEKGLLTREQIEAAKRSNQPQDYTLGPGQQRFAPGGAVEASVPVTPPKPTMREIVVKGPNGRPVKKLVSEDELMQGIEQYEKPDAPARQGLTPNMESNVVRQLATQWTTATKPARDLDRQVRLMDAGIAAAERGDLTQGSQAVLVTFQKLLDPTSVVRESEYARSSAGLALADRAKGAVERIAKGGTGVPVSELKKFAALAREMAQAQRGSYLSTVKERIGRTADRYSIPRELVFEVPETPATDQNADPLGIR